MKFLSYQSYLLLFLFVNHCQCRHNSDSCEDDDNKVQQKLYNATNRFLLSLSPPICREIYYNQNGIRSQYISSQGLTGRLIPAGTFALEILAFEYLYGLLCPLQGGTSQSDSLQSIDVVRIAYDQHYLITQSEIILHISDNSKLTIFFLVAFDKDYKLCGYDGQIRNFGLTYDAKTPQEQQASIAAVCTVAQLFCNGSLQQYSSFEDCLQFLTNNIPYGSLDRADQGNVACRTIHASFTPLAPSIHCPHIGPTGGNACTDKTLDFYYNQPNFLACAHKYKK